MRVGKAVMMTSTEGFWKTMDLLVGKEWRRTGKEVMDDVQDWVEKIVAKRELSVVSEDDGYFTPVSVSSSWCESEIKNKKFKDFIETLDIIKVQCNFSHPHVRSRLEKLMGSNLVCLTDRDYMQKLQERILEDYAESMEKRIKSREAEEMERIKNLVLIGKIPMDQAPPEMANHPVFIIENDCKKLIAERRAKIKLAKVHILTFLYWDDTPDPPSGLSIERGHIFKKNPECICTSPERFITVPDEEDIENGYMFTPEEADLFKYESPVIKELKETETIEEMYDLADEIIGVLKSASEATHADDSLTTFNVMV